MNKEAEKWIEFAEDYDDKVYSLTRFPKRRKQILEKVKIGKILNLGCGSAPYLNYDLIMQGNEVTASDFCPEMINVSKRKFSNPNLEFRLADSKNLPFNNKTFDTVISVNSILPEEREDVYKMTNEVCRVLKNDGIFIAFLIAFGSPKRLVERLGADLKLDHESKRMWDTVDWQCFHTPETIEEMMKKAGFKKYGYKKVFLKTKMEVDDMKKLYDIDTSKCFVFEYFLTAQKS